MNRLCTLYVTNREFCGKQFNEALKTKEHQRRKHKKQLKGKSVVPAMSIRVLNVGSFLCLSRKTLPIMSRHEPKKPPSEVTYTRENVEKSLQGLRTWSL